LNAYGIAVAERVSHVVEPAPAARDYMATKARRGGHLIDPVSLRAKEDEPV
jgi:GTP cyclohydrolase II